MSENEKRDFGGDDFWNLDEYAKKKAPKAPIKQFSKSATQAVEIGGVVKTAPQSDLQHSNITLRSQQPLRHIDALNKHMIPKLHAKALSKQTGKIMG